MAGSAIPDDVLHYVVQRIDSVPELETLMLVHSTPDVDWTAERLAQRVYVSKQMAAALLEKFANAGVFRAQTTDVETTYRYAPSSAEVSSLLDRVEHAYRTALIPLTKLIHSKPRTSLLQFADAFRIGGKDK